MNTQREGNPANQKGIDTMTKNQKMTNKQALRIALDALNVVAQHHSNDFQSIDFLEVCDKVAKMIEGYEKKSATAHNNAQERKSAYDDFKQDIMTFLSDGNKYNATEIWKGVPSLNATSDMTSQRVSVILRQMKESGMVDKQMIKGKQVYWAV